MLQRTDHGKIYLTVIKSFSESKLIGNGPKSFRFKCSKFKSDKTACSSHPHNYHLEILHDSGIIGFSLLSLFVILFLFQKYKNLRFSLNHLDKIIISLLVLNFLIEVFPLKSTGSLFSTWTGTILWTSIAFANFEIIREMNSKSFLFLIFRFFFYSINYLFCRSK